MEKAKSFLSVAFAEPPLGSNGVAKSDSFDMLVCGINGIVYKFRHGVCILAVSVSAGPVACGHVCGGRFVVGAALGQIKVLDRHTLAEVTTFSVHPSDGGGATGSNSRPGTAQSGGGRPGSASGSRPTTAGSAPRGAGGASNTQGPAMTRKARASGAIKGADGKPVAAWGGPSSGFVSEKCSKPLPPPEGIKASTNVTSLAIELGSYSSQVLICFYLITLVLAKILNYRMISKAFLQLLGSVKFSEFLQQTTELRALLVSITGRYGPWRLECVLFPVGSP